MSLAPMNITLGYGGWNYPYLYRDTQTGHVVGFMADVWTSLGDVIFEQFPYENSSGSECDGVLQAIQQGRILSASDGSSLTGIRNRLFYFSAPAYYTAFEFFEAERSAEIASADLTFFTVFSLPALAVLLALHFLASFIQFLISTLASFNDGMNVQRNSFSDGLRSVTNVFYVLGITVTVYYHAAGFRGNAIDFKHGGRTSFPDLLAGLRSGSRRLITLEENAFSEPELQALFGDSPRHIVFDPDQTSLLQKLCDDKTLVAMLERNMVKSMSLVERPCALDNIQIANRTPGLERLGSQIMQNYLFSRNLTSIKTVEEVNQILLRMYSQDRIENLWTKRYLKVLRNYVDPLEEDLGVDDDYFMPMSLLRLELLFFVTIPGWVLAILLFIVELTTVNTVLGRVLRALHVPEKSVRISVTKLSQHN